VKWWDVALSPRKTPYILSSRGILKTMYSLYPQTSANKWICKFLKTDY
jgi:hypothetical protein